MIQNNYKILQYYSFRFILFIVLILTGQEILKAQPFPINANIVVLPPAGVSLAEYQQTLVPKIQVSLLLTDLTKPQFNVRLRLTIAGQGLTLMTQAGLVTAPITLFPGQPLIIDQAQIASYFNFNNMTLEGMDRSVFINRGLRLPEGTYNFCLEVFDYNRPDVLPVSNYACGLAMLQEYEPPLLMVPDFTNTFLFEDQPPAFQQTLFTWHPMHIGVFPVEYQLRIYRGLPSMDQLPDNIIMTQTAPYISITTNSTFYNLGPLDPPLLQGEQYYAIVQVKPFNYPAIFKNKGNSKYVIFTLSAISGEVCTSPQEYKGNNDRIGIAYRWKMSNNCSQFVTEYYAEPEAVLTYKALNFSVSEAFRDTLTEVLNNMTYVLRTGCICQNDTLYSDTIRIEYNRPRAQPPEYECGSDQQMADAIPVLLPVLHEGDTILANDMEVIIRKAIGSNGIYTGKGHITVPYINFARVNVEFMNITVNDEYRMINGEMRVKGIGQNVLSDATLEDIMNMLDALEDISSMLGDLIDILTALDELIKSLEGFMPPWLIAELKAIQEAMANNPSEEELEALKAHLADINKQMHEWELLYFNVIIEAIENLYEEQYENRNEIVSNFNQKSSYFLNVGGTTNGPSGANSENNNEGDSEYTLPINTVIKIKSKVSWSKIEKTAPVQADKGQALVAPMKKYAAFVLLEKFENELDTKNIGKFLEILTLLGKNLISEIKVEFESRDWDMEVINNDESLPPIIEDKVLQAIYLIYYGI